jgi:hypothetical protein
MGWQWVKVMGRQRKVQGERERERESDNEIVSED